MTPNTVITAVRERLGDVDLERWDDATLILYVSMCQSDICMNADIYKREYNIELKDDTLRYQLPTDFLALNRLEYQDEMMPVESRNTIDAGDATFPCALKDNLIYNEIEIRLGEQFTDLRQALTNVYGVAVLGTDQHELDNIHGVVATVDSDGGVIPPQPLNDLKVFYTAVPPIYSSSDMTRKLEIPDIWFGAFLHYVCSMALQDDNDANNIQRGELEAGKYSRLLANIMKTMAKDSTSNIATKLTTKMRRI